jgi:hypothetical protein
MMTKAVHTDKEASRGTIVAELAELATTGAPTSMIMKKSVLK